MRPHPLLVGILASFTLAGCADLDGTPPDLAASAIVGGEVTEDYPEVVALYFQVSLIEGGLCSGTVIHDEWVLTAAHCPIDGFDLDASKIIFGHDIHDPELEMGFDEVYVHPDYNGVSLDVAVLHLEEPSPVEPIPINRDDIEDLDGELLTFVGFGLSEPGQQQVDGLKRVTEMELSGLLGTAFYYADDDSMTSNGDSGGPALWDFGDGPRVVGVTSWGDPEHVTFGVSTRADSMAEWIDGYTGGDSPPWDDDDADGDGGGDGGGEGCECRAGATSGNHSGPWTAGILAVAALVRLARRSRRVTS